MSVLIISYKLIDGEHQHEQRYPNKMKALNWLNSVNHDDFEFITLRRGDVVLSGYKEIYEYCKK
jgi:regulator of PEP synthase PpsR (kinase-PPPase family)